MSCHDRMSQLPTLREMMASPCAPPTLSPSPITNLLTAPRLPLAWDEADLVAEGQGGKGHQFQGDVEVLAVNKRLEVEVLPDTGEE